MAALRSVNTCCCVFPPLVLYPTAMALAPGVRTASIGPVFLSLSDEVDPSRAAYLALSRMASLRHALPFSLSAGGYRVFVYDIESDGTLASGVGYPAVKR